MRWERLFQDLEDQLDRETDAELEDIARDEERRRLSRLTMRDRLRELIYVAAGNSDADITNGANRPVTALVGLRYAAIGVSVLRVGGDWILVQISTPQLKSGTALIPIAAVRYVEPVLVESGIESREQGTSVAKQGSGLTTDIGLAFVLRDLSRRRRQVTVWMGEDEVSGTIDRVGKDHVDISRNSTSRTYSSEQGRRLVTVACRFIDVICLD